MAPSRGVTLVGWYGDHIARGNLVWAAVSRAGGAAEDAETLAIGDGYAGDVEAIPIVAARTRITAHL